MAESKVKSPESVAAEFAEAIKDCEEYKKFLVANEALSNDKEAISLLKQFQEKQIEIQSTGDEELIRDLEDLQVKLRENKSFKGYNDAQARLVSLLRETNLVISSIIDSDFAVKQGCCGGGGGCCG